MLNQSLMAHLQKAVMSNTAESVHELESAPKRNKHDVSYHVNEKV
jgi:hypothetical protein